MNLTIKKLIFGLTGIGLIWISFFIMDRKFLNNLAFNDIFWSIVYSICLFIGAFVYNVQGGEDVGP